MLSKTIETALNEQIKHEMYSSYLYLSMSAYCEAANLAGSAHWLRAQTREEYGHAMKFYGYIHDQGGRVVIQALAQPPAEWTSMADLFQQVLEHERKVTSLINNLQTLAVKEGDYATQNFLAWFINEQVEEEKHATQIVEQLKMIGNSGQALFMMDRQLAARAG